MTSNLKLVLSAVGVVALVASPAMAKPRNHDAIRALQNVPADTRAAVDTYAPSSTYQKVYGADLAVPAHHGSINPDFQLGADR